MSDKFYIRLSFNANSENKDRDVYSDEPDYDSVHFSYDWSGYVNDPGDFLDQLRDFIGMQVREDKMEPFDIDKWLASLTSSTHAESHKNDPDPEPVEAVSSGCANCACK